MGCFGSAPQSEGGNKNENKILVIVGPSGVGKDTVMANEVLKHKDKFKKGVTHTTRGKREGEQEGVNYYYVSKEEFLKMKDNNELVEFNEYNGNYYGLSKKELENGSKGDKILYVIIDINGANAIKKLNIPANYVSVLPPDEGTLEKRLKGRGTETAEAIKGRLNTAKSELKAIGQSALFNIKVINQDLQQATNDFDKQLKDCYPTKLE